MAISKQMLEAYGNKKIEEYTHWVYILECHVWHREFNEVERKAEKRLDRTPWWLRPAFEADRVYYVGQTENKEKRIGKHFKQKNAADFTTMFEPTDIHRLIPKHSRNQAEWDEKSIAESMREKDGVFAYYR